MDTISKMAIVAFALRVILDIAWRYLVRVPEESRVARRPVRAALLNVACARKAGHVPELLIFRGARDQAACAIDRAARRSCLISRGIALGPGLTFGACAMITFRALALPVRDVRPRGAFECSRVALHSVGQAVPVIVCRGRERFVFFVVAVG